MACILRTTAAAATLAFALTGAGLAQTTAWVEIDDDVMVTEFNQTADALDDMDVYSSDGTKIGEVDEVLGRVAGTATAVSLDFDDDTGMGDRDDVVVPLDQLAFANDRLTLNADAAAIALMEVYDDDDDDDSDDD